MGTHQKRATPRRSTSKNIHPPQNKHDCDPKSNALLVPALLPARGGMGKRTLFQGIDPVSDIEQGLQGVGQDLLNMFDGGTMIVQEGGLDTIDTTLLDELEQEPDATVSGLTVAVGSEPSGQMVFKPEQLDIKSGDTVTWLNVDGLEHNIVFSRVPDGVDKSALDQRSIQRRLRLIYFRYAGHLHVLFNTAPVPRDGRQNHRHIMIMRNLMQCECECDRGQF